MSRRGWVETAIKGVVILVIVGVELAATVNTQRAPVNQLDILSAAVMASMAVVWVVVLRREVFRRLTYWILVAGVGLLFYGYLHSLLHEIWRGRFLVAMDRVTIPAGMLITTVGLVLRVRDHRIAYHALEEKEEQFRRLSVTDSLTGLFNSKQFFDIMETEVGRAQRYGRELSLAFLDIDNFKSFNDQNGHLEGDRLLREVARIIQAECRENDTPFRYGGEEFTVLFPETALEQAIVVADRIRERVEANPFRLKSGEGEGRTVSIGVATYASPGQSIKELIDQADRAMYRAKMAGKNRVFAEGEEDA